MGFVVTIDGPAAAGKSTTAQRVARALGYLYLDTGALYRALALHVLRMGVDPDDPAAVAESCRGADLRLEGSTEHPCVLLDGADVTREIREPRVSEMASRLAAYPQVRAYLVAAQRSMAARGPVVAEGPDLGTVVFPAAEAKIYLDADLDTRARRRYEELAQRGIGVPLDEVRSDMERRDERDRTRADSPLKPAPDAERIDTTGMTIDQQVQAVLAAVERARGRRSG
jgi:cytidylate kinase